MKEIHLRGVKQNNLKNIDIDIQIGSFTVVCGPSGSGKSSLAFETLYAEGQRRYMESLSNYARQFVGKAPKPDVESVSNIPPAISIEQKNAVKTSRSTVGTTTEVIDYLRLLYEKLGTARCPTYGFPIKGESPSEAIDRLLQQMPGKRIYFLAPLLEKGRVADPKNLLKLLLADGYVRIFIPPSSKSKPVEQKETTPFGHNEFVPCVELEKMGKGEIREITPATPLKEIPKKDFYIVIDRAVVNSDDKGRLVDSLTQAYQASLKFNTEIPGGRARILSTEGELLQVSEDSSCAICGFSLPNLSSQFFSFNNPLGACSTCNGFGNVLDLDPLKIVPNPRLSLAQGAVHPFSMPSAASDRKLLKAFCSRMAIPYDQPWDDLTQKQRDLVWNGDGKFFGVTGLFGYLETKKYKMHVRVFLSRYKSGFKCPTCHGRRLKPETEMIKIKGYSLSQLSQMTIGNLHTFFHSIEFTAYEREAADEVIHQVGQRLDFLKRVGVEYITLDRPTRTLSGGEYQRLILAKQLGMGLSQTLYVLDEPTVGLHPRDNDRLIGILKDINALGNTLVVVEHDRDVIEGSTHVIEMGPGSGHLGGEVIFEGRLADFYKSKKSITVPYLLNSGKGIAPSPRTVDIDTYKYKMTLKGCRGNNLKNIDVSFPMNRLVTVTGVSGSGKSTLVTHTLYPALARKLGLDFPPVQPFDSLKGDDLVKDLVLVDQSPVGKTARSSPVTYLKIFDTIRDIMANTQEAKDRGYTGGTFSLNVEGGRCPVCKGLGYETIDMLFMDDVEIPCEACDGNRYRDEVLEVRYQGKNINEILKMTVDEAMEFYVSHPTVRKPLALLKSVGLEYIQLGQSASSLSGGESQRLKIARELMRTQQKSTLYIMDEPTTGLHFREIDLLLKVLNQLIEAGGSVILIEHNLEVIARSDYIIDIGLEAGETGGELLVQGSPLEILSHPQSHTARYLRQYLQEDTRKAPKHVADSSATLAGN